MGKGRFEAFSDGVLAIIITIMVLELKVPHGTDWHAIQPVTNGTSDSQNNRCRLAHIAAPETRVVAWSMWWWLFQ